MLGWKGNFVSGWDIHAARDEYGSPYWDFHRSNLHRCLYERAIEIGATVLVNARVEDIIFGEDETAATVMMADGSSMEADLVVGSDGVRSRCRDIMLGFHDPPKESGDLAYRVLLKTEQMLKDPELKDFVLDPQVNYWMGPKAHIGKHWQCYNRVALNIEEIANRILITVSYVLRGGELFNMVLLVPDDLPQNVLTSDGNVAEMQAMFKDWDPRYDLLLFSPIRSRSDNTSCNTASRNSSAFVRKLPNGGFVFGIRMTRHLLGHILRVHLLFLATVFMQHFHI
jgi:salicylate hydroxylase